MTGYLPHTPRPEPQKPAVGGDQRPLRWRHLAALVIALCSLLPVYAADEDEAAAETTKESGDGSAQAPETGDSDGQQPPEPPPPRVLPDVDSKRHQGVIEFLQLNGREYEQVRLVAEENEFYGLFMQERAGLPQGGILILHDQGQHGHWPEIVAPLREQLPDHGWATLSIGLPDAPPPARLPRPVYDSASTETENGSDSDSEETPSEDGDDTPTETLTSDAEDSNGLRADDVPPADAEDQNDDNTTTGNEPALPRLQALPPLPEPEPEQTESAAEAQEDPADIYRRSMQSRIRQGVQYLNQRGQLNIVIIASGASAGWAADFMLQRPDTVQNNNNEGSDRGYTLVIIDAKESPYEQVPLTQKLTGLDIPLLDLVTEESAQPDWQIKERAGAMRHRQRSQYQQIRIPVFSQQYDDSNLILRRVRGWLRTHAAGTELSRKN
ncbi:MAG: hypothetical protein CMI02_02305 [Oceanospirillaceae bacterium]|nr:hypothetical protein [Oceanospirillaceae bacterium]MBT10854.1 hypothetical protein [Oceanospirillaceae bacterium]|tara:strand:- start:115593 stop:116909 length:1317 start_codon:yes stop_codon:yes gene_type:complete